MLLHKNVHNFEYITTLLVCDVVPSEFFRFRMIARALRIYIPDRYLSPRIVFLGSKLLKSTRNT